jgi:hypothetical protein
MEVEIKDGKLVISIELQEPTPSTSGKTLVVATTRGNVPTGVLINNKELILGLNAYIRK